MEVLTQFQNLKQCIVSGIIKSGPLRGVPAEWGMAKTRLVAEPRGKVRFATEF